MAVAVRYVYDATIVHVHDGDTITAILHLARSRGSDHDFGFRILRFGGALTYTTPIRLLGINAPELPTPEGVNAAVFLQGLLPVASRCVIATRLDQREKYGRILGTITLPNTAVTVNQQMIDSGHAVPYTGGAR